MKRFSPPVKVRDPPPIYAGVQIKRGFWLQREYDRYDKSHTKKVLRRKGEKSGP